MLVCRATNSTAIEAIQTLLGFYATGRSAVMNAIGQRSTKEDCKENGQKRIHCWAAIGWNFKSDLFYYTMRTNQNGKLSRQAYLD